MKKIILFLGCSLVAGELAFAAAPKSVVAGPESTVYGIAYEHGIPTRALIAANNLKPPYALKNGQVLIIPAPNEHVIGQGETLKDIADNYGVNVDVLAQENDIQAARPGERLAIPSRDTESMATALKPSEDNISTSSLDPLPSVKSVAAAGKAPLPAGGVKPSNALSEELAAEIAREKGTSSGGVVVAKKETASKGELMGNLAQRNAGAPTAATTLVREEDDVVEKPKKEEKKKAQVKEKEKPKDPPAKKEVTQADTKGSEFMKPVEFTAEDILKKFSPGTNDGIKIKVPEGTAVKAAAAGEVLYAGNGLEGYGNLLLLKHSGGWVTAYAYNSSLLVKKGDTVKKGQVIAKSGKTGAAKVAQLHFELRKGKQPVDPLPKLGS